MDKFRDVLARGKTALHSVNGFGGGLVAIWLIGASLGDKGFGYERFGVQLIAPLLLWLSACAVLTVPRIGAVVHDPVETFPERLARGMLFAIFTGFTVATVAPLVNMHRDGISALSTSAGYFLIGIGTGAVLWWLGHVLGLKLSVAKDTSDDEWFPHNASAPFERPSHVAFNLEPTSTTSPRTKDDDDPVVEELNIVITERAVEEPPSATDTAEADESAEDDGADSPTGTEVPVSTNMQAGDILVDADSRSGVYLGQGEVLREDGGVEPFSEIALSEGAPATEAGTPAEDIVTSAVEPPTSILSRAEGSSLLGRVTLPRHADADLDEESRDD